MGRPSNSAERRQEITAGLMRDMASHGYERATIALIAREAGLASGLVHYHFESKAEILRALVEGLASGARARIDALVAGADSAMGRVDALLDGLLARGESEDLDAVRCWSLIGAEAVTDTEVRALYSGFITELTQRLGVLLVAACHEAGRSGEGSRAMAGALVAMAEGYFALSAAVPDAIPIGSAAAMAKRAARGLVSEQSRLERRSKR